LWKKPDNFRIEVRGIVGGGIDRVRSTVAEVVASNPDLLYGTNTVIVQEMQRQTRAIPIVFANIGDPVDTGAVTNLARPGGNATGFMINESALGGKWLELLKEVAPGLNRVQVLVNSGNDANQALLPTIEASAPLVGVQMSSAAVRDAREIEDAITAVAREPAAGLIVVAGFPINDRRKLIFALAGRYRLPAVYQARFWVQAGGLMSYGENLADMYRRGAYFVDKILKAGEMPDACNPATAIRSLSRRRASYSMAPSHFERVPDGLAAKIVSSTRK
jgi:putative ABC transport system substrate-binding protein